MFQAVTQYKIWKTVSRMDMLFVTSVSVKRLALKTTSEMTKTLLEGGVGR